MQHPFFQRFLAFIRAHALFGPDDRLLVACSGGLDSTALAHLLAEGDYDFALAHVNFHLRGEESDEDAVFARRLARELDVPFFHKDFDTKAITAASPGESMQMTARRLRYEWLEQLRRDEEFDYLLTAHHLDDSVETFLLNFVRGSGLRGLRGIPVRNGRLRRPLLFATRAELAAFMDEHRLDYREDSSNATDTYRRNYLRHHVLPHLYEINPNLGTTASSTFQQLDQAWKLVEFAAQHWYGRIVKGGSQDRLVFDLATLRTLPYAHLLLTRWLQSYGFDGEQARQALEARAGVVLEVAAHQLLVQQDRLVLEPKRAPVADSLSILQPTQSVRLPGGGLLCFTETDEVPTAFEPEPAYLDADALQYPLTVRRRRPGDRFQPLGLGGRSRKLQDYFTDNKIDRLTRDRTWLLVNANGDIVWIVGYRADERYKVRPEARRVVIVKYLPES